MKKMKLIIGFLSLAFLLLILFPVKEAKSDGTWIDNRADRYVPEEDCFMQCVDPDDMNCYYVFDCEFSC